MSEVLVSGKVDTEVEKTANRYITATGTTQDAIIKCVWGYIADTGNVPLSNESLKNALALDQEIAFEQEDYTSFKKKYSTTLDKIHTLQKKTHTNSFMRSLDEKGVKSELEKRIPAE